MIGADQVAQLHRWKDIDALEKEVHLCAFCRDGVDVIDSPYRVRKLDMKEHPASSTKVRNDARISVSILSQVVSS
jgi:nicotinic acid mononucleotide adenylyltransferase